jgi:membrane protease YdiL (CAAX protease family)
MGSGHDNHQKRKRMPTTLSSNSKRLSVKKPWVTGIRVLLFCILCAIALIIASGLMKPFAGVWSQVIVGSISAIAAVVLTKLFVRWEGITMRDVGIVPHRKSVGKYLSGFGIGLFIAILQPALILCMGHFELAPAAVISPGRIIIFFLLFLALAIREEVAFRGYPLFSLSRVSKPWVAFLVTGIIFIIEHIVGGMPWLSAIVGVGAGSLLFGLAALRSRGLALPIGIHSAWNFGQWFLGFKNEPGVFRPVIENGYQDRFDIITWASYLLAIFAGILLVLKPWQRISKRP